MAISFVSSGTNSATTGSAITITKPASIQSGDVIVALIHGNGSSPTITDNNGATPFTDSGLGLRAYNGGSASYRIMHRVAGGSEPASYAWTLGESNRWSVILSVYRGVDTSAIYDVAPTSTSEKSELTVTSTIATKAITTLTDGSFVVVTACADSSTVTFTATPGDSFSSRENNSGEQLIALADKNIPTATTQSAVSWTSSANVGYATNIFSLKMASGSTIAIKTYNGLAQASIKTYNGLATASVKSVNGLSNV